MFLPYRTDAPIYHWPLATLGLIVANTLIFFHAMAAPNPGAAMGPWILWYGQGLHPQQWIGCIFQHINLMHLLGNMFGLWGFGIIVEGKIGWWRFLAVYLGMGVAQSAMEQALVPGSMATASLGASGVIFGLMAISLVWAPLNEVTCFVLFWFRFIEFDLSVAAYCAIMAALQFLTAFLSGMNYGSEALHLVGFLFGLPLGVAMLKLRLVDCEGWDIFSVWAGKHRMTYDQMAALREKNAIASEEGRLSREEAIEEIHRTLDEGRHKLAHAAHRRMADTYPRWRLPEEDFRRIIAGYHREGEYAESIPLMVEYLHYYTEQAPLVRLKLAEILLRRQRQPAQAKQILAAIPAGSLRPEQETFRVQLEQEIHGG